MNLRPLVCCCCAADTAASNESIASSMSLVAGFQSITDLMYNEGMKLGP